MEKEAIELDDLSSLSLKYCKNGDISRLKIHFEGNDKKLNELLDNNGNTLLHYACNFDKSENWKRKRLISLGLYKKENKNSFFAKLPLETVKHIVSYIDDTNFSVLKFLIENGASINVSNKDHVTPLMNACKTNNFKLVSYLIDKGAKIEQDKKSIDTALMYAAQYGDLELVKFLVEKGAELNKWNKKGQTALMLARENSDFSILNYLYCQGANV